MKVSDPKRYRYVDFQKGYCMAGEWQRGLAGLGDQDRFSPFAAMADEPADIVDPLGLWWKWLSRNSYEIPDITISANGNNSPGDLSDEPIHYPGPGYYYLGHWIHTGGWGDGHASGGGGGAAGGYGRGAYTSAVNSQGTLQSLSQSNEQGAGSAPDVSGNNVDGENGYSSNFEGKTGGEKSKGWLKTANAWNGGVGVLAGGVENLSGKLTLGSNLRTYASGWRGNQFVSTIKLAKIGKIAGYGTLVLGTALDAKGVWNYYHDGATAPNTTHPAEAGANLGVGVWGMTNPGTAIGAAWYFGVETFYPGGNKALILNTDTLIRDNQAILGSDWNLFRDY